jgi:hypothetical protein
MLRAQNSNDASQAAVAHPGALSLATGRQNNTTKLLQVESGDGGVQVV